MKVFPVLRPSGLRINRFATIVSLIPLLALLGCSNRVVRRDARGMRVSGRLPQSTTFVKKKMALLTFYNEAPYGGEDLGITATEELRKELARTREFVIDPIGAKMFGSSKEVYSGGGLKLVQVAKKAKLSGLNFVVYGRIVDARVREKTDEIGLLRETKSYTESKIELRIFDVLSNKEIYTETLSGQANDSSFRFYLARGEDHLAYRQQLLRYGVRVAIRRAIPRIISVSSRLDWTGRVARIIGTKIFVNAGRQSGLQVGDILRVMTEGEEVFDPETGALIGTTKGQLKGTLEVTDFFGPDGATAVLHSGGSVAEGDFVQLY